jgi:hypothetical protein
MTPSVVIPFYFYTFRCGKKRKFCPHAPAESPLNRSISAYITNALHSPMAALGERDLAIAEAVKNNVEPRSDVADSGVERVAQVEDVLGALMGLGVKINGVDCNS